MQRDEIHLRNVLRLANEIDVWLRDVDEAAFHTSEEIKSIVLLRLIFIGEATRYISTGLRERYPDVRWKRIVGFRNVTVHRYWEIDWDLVWDAATMDLPPYREQVRRILDVDFPGLEKCNAEE